MSELATIAELRQLAERFQSGDCEAFRLLHERIDGELQAFISARCPRGVDAQGLVQAAWVRVWSHRTSFQNDSIRGWIFQIAKNLLRDEYRRQGRRPKSESWGARDLAEVIQEQQSGRIAALQDCLVSEGGDFVAVLRMQLAGLSTQQIALQMKIAEGSVASRASRGRDQLRDCIERKEK